VRCPAHDDRDPSLSIAFLPDGRVLVHCHAGCEAASVVAAAGLTMESLFPEGVKVRDYMPGGGPSRRERRTLDDEVRIIAIAKADLALGKKLSEPDQARVRTAADRLRRAGRAA